MKQPEDKKTLDLLEQEKRGRGRPRLDHALTPSERAKRYRDNKRLARQSSAVAVTNKNSAVTEKENDALFWREMYEAEAARVTELEARIAAGPRDGFSYAHVTKIAELEIAKFMALAVEKPRDADYWLHCAYGVYQGWIAVVLGYADLGDMNRLRSLTNLS